MNINVYTFCCLLKEYDEDFAALSFQEQYDAAPKYYKSFLTSEHNKDTINLSEAIELYLQARYDLDNSLDLEFEDD
jgi:hypothetical protein